MKKIISMLLSVVFAVSISSVLADEPETDIFMTTLCIDNLTGTVLLNDEEYSCTYAPYVSENGITMVQLSAITDAVDAEVSEDGDRITVTYQGVNFDYSIGAADMQINNQTIPVPEPVTRAENKTVMVPLRYFAESFGADVVYDSETSYITVTFPNQLDQGVNFNLLLKYSSVDKVGNSKEKWRFTKPDDFEMEVNMWGGGCTFYTSDAEIMLSIYNTGRITLDQLYVLCQQNNDFYNVIFEKIKGERAGLPYVCCKYRYTDMIMEQYAFLTDKYIYMFTVNRSFENFASEKNDADVEMILDSFEIGYTGEASEDTIDLAMELNPESEISNEYTDGNMNWHVDLIDNWQVNEYYGFYNYVTIERESELNGDNIEYIFGDYNENDEEYAESSHIEIMTYSVEKGKNINQFINERRDLMRASYNSDFLTMSEVSAASVGENPAQMFTSEFKVTEKNSIKYEYYYIEKGSYRYEIAFGYDSREESNKSFLDNAHYVIQSFKPGDINKEEIGDILESDSIMQTDKITREFDGEFLKLKAPFLWNVYEDTFNAEPTVYISNNAYSYDSEGFFVTILKKPLTYFESDMKQNSKTLEQLALADMAELMNSGGINAVSELMPQKTEMFGRAAYTFKVRMKDDYSGWSVENTYIDGRDGSAIVICRSYPDYYRNTYISEMTNKVIESIELK